MTQIKQDKPKQDHTNSRAHVISTLITIQSGQSLSNLMDDLFSHIAPNDKPFVHHLLLTTLRHWYATARLLDSLADKPIEEIEVRTTIQVGITQLLYLEVADHASIFETVEAVKLIGFARASGLVNAILRKVAKNPNKYRKSCNKKHSLPNWLAKQLKQDWRDQYDDLCQGLRQPAPMFLRVNARQANVTDYGKQLSEAGIEFDVLNLPIQLDYQNQTTTNDSAKTSHQGVCQPIRLKQSQPISQLPNFAEGVVSIQDAHAHIAGSIVTLLIDNYLETSDQPRHILDACTAPSGKLAHCLESLSAEQLVKVISDQHDPNSTASIKVIAIDNAETRLKRSADTLARLHLTEDALLICDDATQWVYASQQGQSEKSQPHGSQQPHLKEAFDIILLDAPCTATGVIRRHPDISLLRQETDVEQTVQLQQKILDNLWSQLKPNGYLIYVTCSILKAENEAQMLSFVARHTDTTPLTLSIPHQHTEWGIEQAIGRQYLPIDAQQGDGFYYAVLQKR